MLFPHIRSSVILTISFLCSLHWQGRKCLPHGFHVLLFKVLRLWMISSGSFILLVLFDWLTLSRTLVDYEINQKHSGWLFHAEGLIIKNCSLWWVRSDWLHWLSSGPIVNLLPSSQGRRYKDHNRSYSEDQNIVFHFQINNNITYHY